MKKILTTLLLCSLWWSPATAAEDNLNYNLVTLQARAASTMETALSHAAAPEVAAGESRVSVSVRGSIQLSF